MNLAAISHNATGQDCFCLEPGRFGFRLRCAKGDIVKVILHHQDKYLPLHIRDTRSQTPMTIAATDNTLDYWETELIFHVVCLRYWFEITDREGKTLYYGNCRFWETPPCHLDDMFDCPQNMREEERFQPPAWAENKVVYQVFPSRFASSRKQPDACWYKAPICATDDLGGDLRGLIQHLPHIQKLGADILYMTPIFRSNSCHKYDTIDYYTIDPAFGTKEDLKELVEQAHAMGLRVILDGVFNHTSPDFFAFADIRKHQQNSPYLHWYFVEEFPLRANRGEKPSYKTFAYFGGMPKLNLKNPDVARYVVDVARYWLRECGVDGWRLDVGDEIGHEFWKQFRREIKAEFPEALIIGEVWHCAEDFLQGDEWDTVMNYPFYQAALRLGAQDTITVSRFVEDLQYLKGHLHPKVMPLLWNLVGSHDTTRLLNHCGGDKRRMKLIAALQLLLPGMPMIYYGDEYAMEGGQDPDCRRGMLWDVARQDGDMYRWYRNLLRMRKAHPGLLAPNAVDRAEDEQGILIRKAGDYTVVFHCKAGSVRLPEFFGKQDLLSETRCNGTFDSFAVAVFGQ